jgi:hypothetical protein
VFVAFLSLPRPLFVVFLSLTGPLFSLFCAAVIRAKDQSFQSLEILA